MKLFTAVALLLACLCLYRSMPRYFQGATIGAAKERILRLIAATLCALGLINSATIDGWGVALVDCLGLLSVSIIIVTLYASYKP